MLELIATHNYAGEDEGFRVDDIPTDRLPPPGTCLLCVNDGERVNAQEVGALSLMLVSAVCAREKAFYRIVSPVGSDITALSADGAVIAWTNAATDAVTCAVQRASSLAPADWRDFVRHEATNAAVRLRLGDRAAPADMVYIPAGSFEMGIDEGAAYNPSEAPLHWVM